MWRIVYEIGINHKFYMDNSTPYIFLDISPVLILSVYLQPICNNTYYV